MGCTGDPRRTRIQIVWFHFIMVNFRGGTNSSMFANCLAFRDVREVWSSGFGQNLKILNKIDPIFINKAREQFGYADVCEVRSLVLGPNGMFECVRSSIL